MTNFEKNTSVGPGIADQLRGKVWDIVKVDLEAGVVEVTAEEPSGEHAGYPFAVKSREEVGLYKKAAELSGVGIKVADPGRAVKEMKLALYAKQKRPFGRVSEVTKSAINDNVDYFSERAQEAVGAGGTVVILTPTSEGEGLEGFWSAYRELSKGSGRQKD